MSEAQSQSAHSFFQSTTSQSLRPQTHKRLIQINNVELFKLAAINMSKSRLLPLMPVDMKVDSIDVNRMRSRYIQMISSVWKAYSKFIFGTNCPIMGTYTLTGEFNPGPELCDACSSEFNSESQIDASKY